MKYIFLGTNDSKIKSYFDEENILQYEENITEKKDIDLEDVTLVIFPYISKFEEKSLKKIQEFDCNIILFVSNSNLKIIEFISDLKSSDFRFKDSWGVLNCNINQEVALVHLVSCIMQDYPDIRISDILGHCELPGVTKTCPNLNMTKIRNLVQNHLNL